MSSMFSTIQNLFTPVKPLPTGMYHYQTPPEDPRNLRMHLRLEPDGRGILIVNGSTILHLNQSAAEYAYYTVRGVPLDQIIQNIVARYRVKPEQARKDYTDLFDRIQTQINMTDLDPEIYLDFERRSPFTGKISAPYRLDCAITYRLPENTPSDSSPVERVKRELDTAAWYLILDKAWTAGIPHILFTGGEPTLREDLLELIQYAEKNEQISGLLTDGLRLADQQYLDLILQTGLDHIMVVLQAENEQSWSAIRNISAADIYLAVHSTIQSDNQQEYEDQLRRLSEIGVKAISLTTVHSDFQAVLEHARNHAAALGMELVWNLPVPYSALNPVTLEIPSEEYDVQAAGKAWLYVEPDGDVLPGQGINEVLGNFLTDPWEKIWKI